MIRSLNVAVRQRRMLKKMQERMGTRTKPCVFVRRVKLELSFSRKKHSICAGDYAGRCFTNRKSIISILTKKMGPNLGPILL